MLLLRCLSGPDARTEARTVLPFAPSPLVICCCDLSLLPDEADGSSQRQKKEEWSRHIPQKTTHHSVPTPGLVGLEGERERRTVLRAMFIVRV